LCKNYDCNFFSDSQPKLASKSSGKIKEEKLPVTSPSTSGVSSAQSCLGPIEALEKFPKLGQHAHLVEAPVFRPTEKEFKDPMRYIERIRREAEPFGMCKIIPPSSFKPECNVDDDMRFTAYNQYIHRMMNRWGQSAKEMAAITKYLETQNVTIKPSNHPLVGGVEIDLPALYPAVQSFGGLTEVIQRKKWGKIADFLRVPKGTQDRGNKLDDVYCKFLLPYDTLSEVERDELLRLVEEEWEEKNKKKLDRSKSEGNRNDNSDNSDESEEDEDEVNKNSIFISFFLYFAADIQKLIGRS
jgi:protein Jumonji